VTDAVDIGGCRIAYRVSGPTDGPGLVLTHSIGWDHSMWVPQIGALQEDYRIVAVDTRGHGGSASPPGPYSLEMLAGDVLAAAQAAGHERFHLAGVSMGGQIALWVAAHHPELLLSVTAANTAARIGDAAYWNARIDAVRTDGMAALAETVPARFAPGFASAHPAWFASAMDVLLSTDPEGYAGCCAALAVSDLGDALGSIGVPTLLIGGELDASTPASEMERLHAAIVGSRLRILEGAAHIANLDQPSAFTGELSEFLASSAA
jgi:3-oxoadipate enol-lactonase